MLQMLIFTLTALILGCAQAQKLPSDVLFSKGQEVTSLEQALERVRPGQVVVLGEDHGTSVMAKQQLQVLEILRKNGHLVSLGMEFFDYTTQALVDHWRAGNLTEADFLEKVGWGQGFSFDFYREQVQFPNWGAEFVVALNAPRALTGRISKVGLSGLSESERSLLPPQMTVGNAAYFERFKSIMGDHLPTPEALQRYFEAQSTWDDTMAWQAAEFLRAHPEQTLVIIVGEFHVQYGGGLPDRLKARGVQMTSFSLVNLQGLTESEEQAAVLPSDQFGARADYVWTSRF